MRFVEPLNTFMFFNNIYQYTKNNHMFSADFGIQPQGRLFDNFIGDFLENWRQESHFFLKTPQ